MFILVFYNIWIDAVLVKLINNEGDLKGYIFVNFPVYYTMEYRLLHEISTYCIYCIWFGVKQRKTDWGGIWINVKTSELIPG